MSKSLVPPWTVIAWAAAGVALAATDALARAPRLAPAFIVGSVLAAAIAYRRGGALRGWADALSGRALIGLHAIRLPIGALFLWQLAEGRLPGTFALRGGLGDVAIGAAALAVAPIAARRRATAVFSLLGLADILLVAATGMYLFLVAHDPLMVAALSSPPYALLPFLVVPAVIAAHLLALARARTTMH